MVKIDELKKLVGEVLKVNTADINDSFVLKTGKLKTSAGSVILSNIVKKIYGVKIDCKQASTFGELRNLIDGSGTEDSPVENGYVESVRSEPIDSGEIINSQFINPLVCGVDIQEIEIFPDAEDYWTESFYTENFTKDEIAYCVTAASPKHSFAARWSAKEALHKCGLKYYNLPFSSIKVVKNKDGSVKLEVLEHGVWKRLPFSCSISHADSYAVAMVTGFER